MTQSEYTSRISESKLMPNTVHSVDVSLPTLIDDQYWNLPGAGNDNIPQQPEGEPSKVAAMVSLISLSQILAFATKTLVSSADVRHGLPVLYHFLISV